LEKKERNMADAFLNQVGAVAKSTIGGNLTLNEGVPGRSIGLSLLLVGGMHGVAWVIVTYFWAYTYLNLRALFLSGALLIMAPMYLIVGAMVFVSPGPAGTLTL